MSVQGIRDTGTKRSFTVGRNYQAAYRILSDEIRRCMQTGMITAAVIVHSDLYTDIRKGVITPTLHGGLGAMPLMVVDVVGLEGETTRIDVINKNANTEDVKAMQAVFSGATLCAPG
jgi:hypothetical protein